MTNTISLTLVHSRGVRFLSDLDKLNSTSDLREKIHSILKEEFNQSYACCPPHLYYLISSLTGIVLLVTAIVLIKFIGQIGFFLIAPGIIGIISPCFYTCWHDKRSTSIYYKAMSTIDSETFGIHKMTGTYKPNQYINTLTISTNTDRLKRIKGVEKAEPNKPDPPKPVPAKKPDPPKKKLAPKKSKSPEKKKPESSKIILADPQPDNPPKGDQPYNPLQPDGSNRLTIDSVPNMHLNRLSNQPMGPYPMYGPYQQFPGRPVPGQYQPFPGPLFGAPPNQNSPFNPNVNMNQAVPTNDLVIHELNVGGNNNQMNYGNDLYTVPSNVLDEHNDNKK